MPKVAAANHVAVRQLVATGGVIAVLVLILALPAAADEGKDILKGHVSASDGRKRLARPEQAQPQATAASEDGHGSAAGQALSGYNAPVDAQVQKGGVEQGIHLEPDAFVIGAKSGDLGLPGKRLSGQADSADMMIAWEHWHKQLGEAIQRKWAETKSVFGIAKVTMTVTKQGEISVVIRSVSIPPSYLDGVSIEIRDDVEQEMKEELAAVVKDTFASLNGNVLLAFPKGSERTQVQEKVTLQHAKDEGADGYTWQKDDYERVKVK